MPIHDWTRVTAGTWHAFHLSWISEIQLALNGGLLPPDYYAQAEPAFGTEGTAPEVEGVPTVVLPPPRTRFTAVADLCEYAQKRRTIVVRYASGDRVVALLELVSPGNKAARHAMRSFVEKAVEAVARGYHLLVIDLFPPTPRDPHGVHAAIWEAFSAAPFEPPPGEPLTLVAYSAGSPKRAYIEPTAVGRELLEMPLFLEPDLYVNVPLEATYLAAYRGVPLRWRRVLD